MINSAIDTLVERISSTLEMIKMDPDLSSEYAKGEAYFGQDESCVLSYGTKEFELLVGEKESGVKVDLVDTGDYVKPVKKDVVVDWDGYSIAALLKLESEFNKFGTKELSEHKSYTQEGMMHRVLGERKLRAIKEDFRIEFADNIYGDHWVYNDRGGRYKVFLRDFDHELGYSDSKDAQINKLGTTKHIMVAFQQLREDKKLYNRLDKTFPFVEIYLDPLNEYRISWYYPESLPDEVAQLIHRYFGDKTFIKEDNVKNFLPFLEEVSAAEQIMVRPEVLGKIDKAYEEEVLQWVEDNHEIPYAGINADLYPYQKKGVEFFTYKTGGILADEMGLGKTLQAIVIAVAKKSIFSFKRTLIVCPASLKDQWKREIEKFSGEKALIVTGTPDERALQYTTSDHYFLIANYESVLRDSMAINKAGIDFLILDEAQRIKNFETKTANAIKRVQKKHVLVLTGTPIENRLSDLYSVMQVVDEEFLGPLWEFSYQHCLFDTQSLNKINGYYDLHELKKKLKSVLLRREKRKVLEQLPNVSQKDVFVKLGQLQQEYHAGYAAGVSRILHKKFLTPADHTRLYQLLAAMRMVCNSTYLVDQETNESSKIVELEHILIEKLDIINSDRKIIIFSEWIKSHKLIGEVLRKHGLSYIEFNGSVPVAKRGALIKKFEDDPECKFFLSTESGGSGLNLQVADTLINFELPWNPAKKNQRIGRIDRLGQKNEHLTVINLIAKDSIEMRITSGLMLKQNLFDGVFDESNPVKTVDFSEKGRSQFLEEIENMVSELSIPVENEEIEVSSVEQSEDTGNLSDIPENIDDLETTSTYDAEVEEVDQTAKEKTVADQQKAAQLEEVLSQGMGFFSGLYKMATGEDIGAEEQKLEVNKETGEVTMKFKLPGFGG